MYEKEFQTLIINEIKKDLRKHDKRDSALTLLVETFSDFTHDHKFTYWLSSKLDYQCGHTIKIKTCYKIFIAVAIGYSKISNVTDTC